MRASLHRSSSPSSDLGFTMLEVAVAIFVLIIALMALTATNMQSHTLEQANRRQQLAEDAMRTMGERITAFSAAAHANPETWATTVTEALTAGGTFGDRFEVVGLDPAPGETTVGTIEVVVDETITDQELGVDLGMPRDLDGDGVVGNTNVSASATLLPVVLRANWWTKNGHANLVRGFHLLGLR